MPHLIFKSIYDTITTDSVLKSQDQATKALAEFEDNHEYANLKIISDEKKQKQLIKKVIGKDKYNLKRIELALDFILLDKHKYQRETESLQVVSELIFDDYQYMKNIEKRFLKINGYLRGETELVNSDNLKYLKKIMIIDSTSLLGGTKLFKYFKKSISKDFENSDYMDINTDEYLNGLYIGYAKILTLLGFTYELAPKRFFEKEMKKVLKHINNFRSNTEKNWLFENGDVAKNQKNIAICGKAFEVITQIIQEKPAA